MEINISWDSYQNREKQNQLNNMNEMKYKRKNDFTKDYIVFDFETTGFNCYNDKIIEIGAIKYKDFIEVERFEKMINPDELINPYILELTGITQDKIDKAPKIENVIDDFLEFIEDYSLVAHNSSFDMRFLMYALIKKGKKYIEFMSIDTLTLSRIYIDETKNHKLKTLKNFLEINNNESHRAIDDSKYASRIASRKSLNLNELIAESTKDIDEDHPLYDVNFCFTGALNDITRKEVGQILVNLGARPQNNVTIKTEYLVLGESSYINYIENNKKSSKLNKAIKYQELGQNIKVISEGDFIDILETQSK